MFDPSEFVCVDELAEFPDEEFINDELDDLDETFGDFILSDPDRPHSAFWEDITEVNMDDIPY